MDARYRVVDGEAGGAIILADGPRLVVDETGCISVPGEFNDHPHLQLMAGLGLIVAEPEAIQELSFLDKLPMGKSSKVKK